jgi:phosphate/sulfate permease
VADRIDGKAVSTTHTITGAIIGVGAALADFLRKERRGVS